MKDTFVFNGFMDCCEMLYAKLLGESQESISSCQGHETVMFILSSQDKIFKLN